VNPIGTSAEAHSQDARPLVVFGTTNHVIVKLIHAINRSAPTWRLLGFIDEDPSRAGADVLGYPVLGPPDVLPTLTETGDLWAFNHVNHSPPESRRVDGILTAHGCRRLSLVHPDVDTEFLTHGENCSLFEGTILGSDVTMGRHVTCRIGCTISHGVRLGDYTYLSPGVTICGDAVLETGADIGTGVTILPDRTVGANTFVGAGSVVTKDLPDNVVAVGYPARVVKRRSP
jgi:sugar O-acyltransferase (sialic acid O-acetyltransferase NeuD family)